MDGIINIYKEKGYTSHDVVARLRGILHIKKIGHTGTLDPDAVGVLPCCIGKGTKVVDLITDRDKEYEAVMRLGVTTDTDDATGNVLTESEVNVDEQELVDATMSFVGVIDQVPPIYSALKINGKKMYELAREGVEFERKARRVNIYAIDIVNIDLPLVTMRIHCSKGTYIRSLCRDIGEKLGCGATMNSLKRTKVGKFAIEDAITLSEVENLVEDGRVEEYLTKIADVFSDIPKYIVGSELDKKADNGNSFYADEIKTKDKRIRIYKNDGTFIGIYTYNEKQNMYKPEKLFFCK